MMNKVESVKDLHKGLPISRRGRTRVNSRKPIYGEGINDADYVTQPLGGIGRCPYFDVWHSMIRRCYSKNSHQRNKTYIGVHVSDEWKVFSNFKTWMEWQHWEGLELDKDFIGDGSLYSSETCVFIPRYLNSAVTSMSTKRGTYSLGVVRKPHLRKRPFAAQGTDSNGKRTHLGVSETELGAHQFWQSWKIENMVEVLGRYSLEDHFHSRVGKRLECIIGNLRQDLLNGVETTSLI